MKNPVSDKKQDVSSDVPGVNRRNTQIGAQDTMKPKDRREVTLKDRKENLQSKTMIDGAEGEGA